MIARPNLLAAGISCLVLVFVLSATRAHAATPVVVQAEGALTTEAGGPASDGLYPLTIRLYASKDAAQPLWQQIFVGVKVTAGGFVIALGADTLPEQALTKELIVAQAELWIGVQVSIDPELPRARLYRTPYAVHALEAVHTANADHAIDADHAAVADALAKPLSGADLVAGTVGPQAIAFTYAGSDEKGGPALNLKCTGCINATHLDPSLLDSQNIAYTAGSGPTNVAAMLALFELLDTAIEVDGKAVGIGKIPATGCNLDVASGGDVCIGGAPVLYTRVAASAQEMDAFKVAGQIVYRSDTDEAFMYRKTFWRKFRFETLCGDGVAESPEECDDGAQNVDAPDKCRTTCLKPKCFDKIADTGEQCDDGNGDNNDSCVSGCKTAACGDGFVYLGVEECDDGAGNANTADKCRTTCVKPKCGDKIKDTAEECDDGNTNANDGCNATCKLETCQPTGQRVGFNSLVSDSASGCWNGNPCTYDGYAWDPAHGQSFGAFGQQITCAAAGGASACITHVGITTYNENPTCQGKWDVSCDGKLVGTITSLGKTCTGSAMSNGCVVTFPATTCAQIKLLAVQDGDSNAGCCGTGQPDSMVTGVSAW